MNKKYGLYGLIISLTSLLAISSYNYNSENYEWIFMIVTTFYFLRKTIDILRCKKTLSSSQFMKFYIPFYSYFK